MEKLISIIIPMYNEEKNIAACLSSLLVQSSHNFHAIFVDDGSSDKTLLVLEDVLTDTDTPFSYTILTQENGGAASAREMALHHCNTPYVISLDADDRYSEDMIQELETTIAHYAPDIVMPDMIHQDNHGNSFKFEFYSEEQDLVGIDCLENSLAGWKAHGCICIKTSIFIKSYADYYALNPQRLNYVNNDEIITRLNFYNSASVRRCKGIYFYQYNAESTTNSVNPQRYLRCLNAIILDTLFQNISDPITRNVQIELFNTIRNTRRHLKNNKNNLPNSKKWKGIIRYAIRYLLLKKGSLLTPKQKLRLLKYYISL